MNIKKNWFYQFCIALAMIIILYSIITGFSTIGVDKEYAYVDKGFLILEMFGLWMVIHIFASITARWKILSKIKAHKKWLNIGEAIFVIGITVAAVIVRIVAIQTFPMEPASDYKTYYEIALLLKDGTIQTLGKGYSDYIAMFPHVMGYCYILKIAFTWFGTNVLVGQYLNVFFSVSTMFFLYRIARKLGGRIAGIVALLCSAFWISQVLYITMLSAEYVFTFFLYASVWLFVSLLNDYDENTEKSVQAILLYILLGVLIAITSAIRPMGMILLIAIILCLLPQKMKLQNIPRNDIPLAKRMIEKGWMRCILIVIPYLLVSGIITTNIELEIDKTLPSSTASFGYNLLVGLNMESVGGWNEEDSNLLYESLEETGSATEAHMVCRDLAFERLTNNPEETFNLFVNKFELLWGNDDYGATWNLVFLEEQGKLTEEKSDFLYKAREYNNTIYILVMFFSMIALSYLLKKEGSGSYVLLLVFLGTVAIHLFVESQNRYHYFILQVFMLFAALATAYIFADEKEKRKIKLQEKVEDKLIKDQEQSVLETYQAIEDKTIELKKKAMVNTFDMESAIKNGHVIMTVTPSYGEKIKETLPEKAEEKEEGKSIKEVTEGSHRKEIKRNKTHTSKKRCRKTKRVNCKKK